MRVITQLLEQGTLPTESKELKRAEKYLNKIDRIIFSLLKADRFPNSQLGVIHMYLQRFGGTPGTFDYSIKRIHDSLGSQKLFDIGMALINAAQLDNPDNIQKFFRRVEQFIILTHDQLIKGKNLSGVISIMVAFESTRQGSIEFWKRIEQILLTQIQQKRHPLEKEQALQLL